MNIQNPYRLRNYVKRPDTSADTLSMMYFSRILLGSVILTCAFTFNLFALGTVGDKKTSELTLPFDVISYGLPEWHAFDRNEDGRTDYAVKYDKKKNKEYESFDFNYDGKMDDFYVYEAGLLVRREVDTKFTGIIDLWVYIHEGMYVKGFERSTKQDGVIDLVRDFGPKAGPRVNVSDRR